MKRIYDITDAEVLALTDEQINRFVDIECANEGVPLLPDYPVAPEYDDEPAPDATVYGVSGVSGYFANQEQALSVIAALAGCEIVSVGYGSPKVIKSRESWEEKPSTLTEVAAWSESGYDAQREVIENNKRKKAEYDSLLSDYRSALDKRNKTSSAVYSHIEEIRATESRRQVLAREFDRYKELADGDADIAVKFLLAAHDDAVDFGYSQSDEAPSTEED
jgi:hypothetical protein